MPGKTYIIAVMVHVTYEKRVSRQSWRRVKLLITVGAFCWILASLVLTVPIWPYVWYRLSPESSVSQAEVIGTLASSSTTSGVKYVQKRNDLPPLDTTLPEQNGIIIPKIDVRTEILEGTDYQKILMQGVWRVPDFGNPEEVGRPMILAAHRFGYIWWTPIYRTLHSFYNLPNLKVGDKVNIIWNQRKYTYEIYKAEDGEAISDYSADLILYTCRLFNSPIRVFRYARIVSS